MMPETQYQKHTTHTDALDTLGTIIGDGEKCDAIHIAVFPIEAAERLSPGDHVVINDAGRASWVPPGRGIGITDPFLTNFVFPGERCWVLLYPRQITSLRHVWEHPAFPASQETAADPVADVIAESDAKAASEQWLRDFCDNADVPGFHETIGAALAQQEDDYVHFSGVDAHGEIPDEFWYHLGIYTGEAIVSNPAKHFSCGC